MARFLSLLPLLCALALAGCPDETISDDDATPGDDDDTTTGDDDDATPGDDDDTVGDGDDSGGDDDDSSAVPDSDGDGWNDDEDCAPEDPTIHPGAPESCNGIDDDCDGAVPPDEADLDGDGFMVCDGDCDDADGALHPGAAEQCNGIDDDCDGVIPADEADGDGDGFTICDGDCDDANGAVHPGAAELCNGADDDCDGVVPADELDTDGDGQTPCNGDCDDADADVYVGAPEDWYDGVDSDCNGAEDPDPCGDSPPQTGVPQLGSCTYVPPVGAFTPEVEWRMDTWATHASYNQFMAQPVVAQITDDDGDGLITGEDTPDILACAFSGSGYGSPGVLRVVSGDGSGEHWSLYEAGSSWIFGAGTIAVGDIDADGFPEIITMDANGYPVCISHEGVYEWTGGGSGGQNGASPAIADLDQDGTAEIIVGHRIFSHEGVLEGEGAYGSGTNYSLYWYGSSAVADVDADGVLDVVAGNAIYAPDGSAIWSNGEADGNPAVADFDGDAGGEIAVVSSGTLRLQDDDGSIIWGPVSLSGGSGGGPPTIADYDGDGEPEIGVAGNSAYDVFDGDGSLLWSNTTQDNSSQRTGSAVFDFDGDGISEVVYADELNLYIYSGPDGTVLYQESDHASGTLMEYPVVADVDADGNAEIVLISNNYTFSGWTGITVIGDLFDNWVSARPIWNQHAYHITNVEDDGSIPVVEPPNWPTYNSFRQGGFGTANPLDGPDLFVESIAACPELCPDSFDWLIRPANQGAVDLPSSVWVSIYAEDAGGTRTLVDLVETTLPMAMGSTSETLEIELDMVTLNGLAAVAVVAVGDDIGGGVSEHNECDEGNNEVVIGLPVCP